MLYRARASIRIIMSATARLASVRVRGTDFQTAAMAAVLCVLILLGLFQSVEIVFHFWGADSDVADPVLLSAGLVHHGWHFVTAWRYTQDNWLLSLMPLDFALFSVFGDRPVVVVLTGLMFFYVMVLLTGVMVGRMRGVRAGGFTVAVLLFAGQPTLGNEGFLAYAVSHGVSIVWGMFGLLFAALWISRRRGGFLVAAGLCLFVGALSDPWDDAAFLAPMTVAGAVLGWVGEPGERRLLAAIAGMGVVVAVLVLTKGLGLLGFLPGASHQFASFAQMVQNFLMAMRYVSVFLNLLPGSFPLASTTPPVASIIVDNGVFAVIVLVCAVRLAQRYRAVSLERRFVAVTALGSIGLMIAALVVTGFQQGMVTARYLSNLFVAVPLLMAASPGGVARFSLAGRGGVLVLGGLFIGSGMISGRMIPLMWPPRVTHNGIGQMAAFLERHDVTFGYGPYWRTEANAMGWVTHNAVTIRPMVFDPGTSRFIPKAVQTAAHWYRPAAVRRAPRRMAFIVANVAHACGAVRSCAAVAAAQFGAPVEILPYRAVTVLIYDHRLYLDPP